MQHLGSPKQLLGCSGGDGALGRILYNRVKAPGTDRGRTDLRATARIPSFILGAVRSHQGMFKRG